MPKLPNKSRGFTLVEVMIAGVILIISVSAMTLVYRTAALSSQKASDNVKFSSSVGLIFNTIQAQIRGGYATAPMAGEGTIAGVKYRWTSRLLRRRGAAKKFDIENEDWTEQPIRYYLWDVELTVESGSRDRVYRFKELSWKK